MEEALFIELLQVAVGRRRSLSRTPSDEEWHSIYQMAVKQAVAGVCFCAVQRLHACGQVPPQLLIGEWFATADAIRKTSERTDRRCQKVQKKLLQAGIRSSILKGQAVARYYGHTLAPYRQPGDIDVFADCGLQGALRFAHNCGLTDVKWDYKHLRLEVFSSTDVELHYRVEVLLNPFRNYDLQRWFRQHEQLLFSPCGELVAPTTAFNRFYILLHIYRHFLYEGVGLRQLMDYYYVLLADDDADAHQPFVLDDALRRFGMWRFTRGVMWLMQYVFALPAERLICEPLESEGRFILDEVMAGGNFGHYDERLAGLRGGRLHTVLSVCRHNLHLLKHYPSEVPWPPVWFVWHKCWKWWTKQKNR